MDHSIKPLCAVSAFQRGAHDYDQGAEIDYPALLDQPFITQYVAGYIARQHEHRGSRAQLVTKVSPP